MSANYSPLNNWVATWVHFQNCIPVSFHQCSLQNPKMPMPCTDKPPKTHRKTNENARKSRSINPCVQYVSHMVSYMSDCFPDFSTCSPPKNMTTWMIPSESSRFFACLSHGRGTCSSLGQDVAGPATGRSYIYIYSLDWFKGKFTGNHGFYHQI